MKSLILITIVSSLTAVFILSYFPLIQAEPLVVIKFVPQLPTEKSNIITYISIPSQKIWCSDYSLNKFELSEHELIFRMETKPFPSSVLCPPSSGNVLFKQEIGHLKGGAYTATFYIDGRKMSSEILYVTPSDIEVIATGKYIDEQGDVHIVGDVRNTATYPAKLVELDIGFIKNDQVISHDKVFTSMAVLVPNATSGFDLLVTDKNLKSTNYFVNVSSYHEDTNPNKKGLRLVVESTNHGIVSGKIFNDAENIQANNVKVACTLYDPSKTEVFDSIFDYTIPSSIEPGQSADFSIASHHKPINFDPVANCNAESSELAIQTIVVVPEFPFTMVLVLGLGLLVQLIFCRTTLYNL